MLAKVVENSDSGPMFITAGVVVATEGVEYCLQEDCPVSAPLYCRSGS